MTTTIALAGKGGVGKTTISALIIKYLLENNAGAVLAIDADPSSNLNMALGLELDWTVGDIRENLLAQVQQSLTAGGAAMGTLSGGMTKRDYLNYHIRSSLIEGDRFDLIAMGRSEGAGCYCAVNHNLREVIDSMSKNYRYVIIDNEAGMEHLSRRTTRDVDILIIVSDPTLRGLSTAERIASLRKELDVNIATSYLIVNRLENSLSDVLKDRVSKMDIPLLGSLPSSQELLSIERDGLPMLSIDSQSEIYQTLKGIVNQIM